MFFLVIAANVLVVAGVLLFSYVIGTKWYHRQHVAPKYRKYQTIGFETMLVVLASLGNGLMVTAAPFSELTKDLMIGVMPQLAIMIGVPWGYYRIAKRYRQPTR